LRFGTQAKRIREEKKIRFVYILLIFISFYFIFNNMSHQNIQKLWTVTVCVSIIIQLVHSLENRYQCRTPDSAKGVCISIYGCESLLNILKSTKITQEQSKYLRNSQCKNGIGDRLPYVCCKSGGGGILPAIVSRGPSGGGAGAVTRNPIRSSSLSTRTSSNTLPEPGICGAEPIGGRIYSGVETGLYDFPWFVLIEYVIGKKKQITRSL
jgi:hypothetical protein